ncbi:methyl-accepting chemotaxis protein [Curvibacter sp. APW13]|uniref:methyl-accepting chemotaxis protein n=1 Tax=Curvibacter sp. APW13 TaxID=3077236 RepID=UPI0028DFEAD6|nr:methyl-accepting chemotaxis protein [Curvibacter sp. APW13]MDT8991601.1 methyl-accepting chemotaxis protein [Curvibacter sp. APW13]
MKNLNIGVRLGMGFALVLLLGTLVGLMSINRLAVVNGATEDIATNWLVATRALGAYRKAVFDIRLAEASHAMANKEEQFAEAEKRIAEGKAKAAEFLETYAKTVVTDEERPFLEAIQKAERDYYATQPAFLKLSRASDGVTDELRGAYGGAASQAFANLIEAIGKDVDFQTKGADAAYQLSQSTYANTRNAIIGLLVLSLAIGSALAWSTTRSITVPVTKAVAMAESVAGGDLTNTVHVEQKDEIGRLVNALSAMTLALSDVVGKVRNGSEGVATAASEIAQGNQDLSSRTESQASALEETAASMEELSSTVSQNADAARQANQLAMTASTVASRGGAVVAEVVETMKGINDASRKISDIIAVIDGIAFQTNILALNAAVEAARAGEQGRGFAVVASEVRSLAGRSAEAAKEIKALINTSVERVEKGAHLVDQAGNTMTEIVDAIRNVTDLMSEISAASSEQAAGVNQVGEAVQQMDQVTQQNAALVEQMAAAASSLRSQADDLVNVVAVFKVDTDRASTPVPMLAVSKPLLAH